MQQIAEALMSAPTGGATGSAESEPESSTVTAQALAAELRAVIALVRQREGAVRVGVRSS